MRLLLDEDSGSHSLLRALRAAGHDVLRVVDVAELGNGATDESVFMYVSAENRVLLTKNGPDFFDIASRPDFPRHHGILLIHYEQDGTSVAIASVVLAISNISQTYEDFDGLFLSVNQHVW